MKLRPNFFPRFLWNNHYKASWTQAGRWRWFPYPISRAAPCPLLAGGSENLQPPPVWGFSEQHRSSQPLLWPSTCHNHLAPCSCVPWFRAAWGGMQKTGRVFIFRCTEEGMKLACARTFRHVIRLRSPRVKVFEISCEFCPFFCTCLLGFFSSAALLSESLCRQRIISISLLLMAAQG